MATVAAVLMVAALGVPGAAGAVTWLGPMGISEPGAAAGSSAQVAVGPYSRTAVVWWDASAGGRVLLARHPPGGAWSPPVVIGTSASEVTPLVAFGKFSTITAVWSDPGGLSTTVATWPVEAATPSLETLGQTAASTMAVEPIVVTQLVMNSAGGAILAGESGANDIAFASRASDADPFAFDVRAGGTDPARDPHVALNESGAAVLVYRVGDDILASRRGSALEAFAPAQAVNAGIASATSPDQLSVGIDQYGDALVGFTLLRGASRAVGSAWSPPGGAWAAQWPLTPLGAAQLALVFKVNVTVDATGEAFLAWRQAGDGSEGLRSYVAGMTGSSTTGVWGPTEVVQELSAYTPYGVSLPSAVSFDGGAVVVWDAQDPAGTGQLREVARVRAADGTWSDVQPLGPYGLRASPSPIATDRTAVVTAETTASGLVLVSVLDHMPPGIGPVSVPKKGHAGEPLSFSASAGDYWSDSPITWDFGDGTSAAGATVTHVFANAGLYLVGASATDAAGNTGSFARPEMVTISAQRTTLTAQLHAVWKRSRLTGKLVVGGTVPRSGTYTLDVTHGRAHSLVRSFRLAAGTFTRSIALPPALVPGRYVVVLEPPVPATQVRPASVPVRLGTPAAGVIDHIALSRSGTALRVRIHFVARAQGRLLVTWWITSHGRRRILARVSKRAAFVLTSTARLRAARGRVTLVVSRAGVVAAERAIGVP